MAAQWPDKLGKKRIFWHLPEVMVERQTMMLVLSRMWFLSEGFHRQLMSTLSSAYRDTLELRRRTLAVLGLVIKRPARKNIWFLSLVCDEKKKEKNSSAKVVPLKFHIVTSSLRQRSQN